jgi:hypothetical protein
LSTGPAAINDHPFLTIVGEDRSYPKAPDGKELGMFPRDSSLGKADDETRWSQSAQLKQGDIAQ